MATLATPTIGTKSFRWDKEKRTFSAFASDLPDLQFGQAYDDAIDSGFTLVSASTGKEVRLVETAEERRDGNLLHWEFRPIDRKDRDSFVVVIFND